MQGGFGQAYKMGVDKYYTEKGSTYQNPHYYDIERIIRKKFGEENPYINKNTCGSGEVTLALRGIGYKNFEGIDPYTFEVYEQKTGLKCEKHSFVDIVNGVLQDKKYDGIIISYALHLVKQSMLYDFCQKLTQISPILIVIAPHKFPIMKQHYGWKQVQTIIKDKIYLRIFKSLKQIEQ